MKFRHSFYVLGLLVLMAISAQSIASKGKHELIMFSIDYCPSCVAAKRFLSKHDIAYSEYNLHESKKAREAFERLGGRGTPLLFLDGETMNGFHPQRFQQFWRQTTGENLETQ